MKRDVRNVLGQSNFPCWTSSLSLFDLVRSSNAAAASAVRMIRIASYGTSGRSTGIRLIPSRLNTSSAASSNCFVAFDTPQIDPTDAKRTLHATKQFDDEMTLLS